MRPRWAPIPAAPVRCAASGVGDAVVPGLVAGMTVSAVPYLPVINRCPATFDEVTVAQCLVLAILDEHLLGACRPA